MNRWKRKQNFHTDWVNLRGSCIQIKLKVTGKHTNATKTLFHYLHRVLVCVLLDRHSISRLCCFWVICLIQIMPLVSLQICWIQGAVHTWRRAPYSYKFWLISNRPYHPKFFVKCKFLWVRQSTFSERHWLDDQSFPPLFFLTRVQLVFTGLKPPPNNGTDPLIRYHSPG